MQPWFILSMMGLSLGVAGSALHPAAATGEAAPFDDADVEELAGTERSCLTPRWGESEACAAFALASGATVEVALLEVKDPDGNDHAESIHFRLYDVKGQTTVANRTIPVGEKFTYVNSTDGLLDLVVHARNDTVADKRNGCGSMATQ